MGMSYGYGHGHVHFIPSVSCSLEFSLSRALCLFYSLVPYQLLSLFLEGSILAFVDTITQRCYTGIKGEARDGKDLFIQFLGSLLVRLISSHIHPIHTSLHPFIHSSI